jgi:hypothetical protein
MNIFDENRRKYRDEQYGLRNLHKAHCRHIQRVMLKELAIKLNQKRKGTEQNKYAQLQASTKYVPSLRTHGQHAPKYSFYFQIYHLVG